MARKVVMEMTPLAAMSWSFFTSSGMTPYFAGPKKADCAPMTKRTTSISAHERLCST